MNRLQIAKYGIPIAIVSLLISAFYTPAPEVEPVEQHILACIRSVCIETPDAAASICENYSPRMGNIMLVKDRDTGSRSVVIKMSETTCTD